MTGLWMLFTLVVACCMLFAGLVTALTAMGPCLSDEDRRTEARLALGLLVGAPFAWLWPVALVVGLCWLVRTAVVE